jgi:hypothetical protein
MNTNLIIAKAIISTKIKDRAKILLALELFKIALLETMQEHK